jgi:hypothetical protein
MITFKASEPRPPQTALLKPGDYAFRVLDAGEKRSQNGNEMIELKLDVYVKGGADQSIVYDNLVFTEKSAWKIDTFLMACGMHPGDGADCHILGSELVGWEGHLRLANEKDQNGNLRNKVAAYLWDSDLF